MWFKRLKQKKTIELLFCCQPQIREIGTKCLARGVEVVGEAWSDRKPQLCGLHKINYQLWFPHMEMIKRGSLFLQENQFRIKIICYLMILAKTYCHDLINVLSQDD